jgi:hypothetical protein
MGSSTQRPTNHRRYCECSCTPPPNQGPCDPLPCGRHTYPTPKERKSVFGVKNLFVAFNVSTRPTRLLQGVERLAMLPHSHDSQINSRDAAGICRK